MHLPIFKENSDDDEPVVLMVSPKGAPRHVSMNMGSVVSSGSKKAGLEKRILYTDKQKAEQLEKMKEKKVLKAGQSNKNNTPLF